MACRITTGLAGLLSAALVAAQPAVSPPDPWTRAGALERQALIAAVVARNPGLEAARRALAAARSVPRQAGSLEDPMVSYGLAPASLGAARMPVGHEIEISQPLPYPGKRRLRVAVALAEAESAAAELERLELELARRASELYDDAFVLRRALEINAEHAALLQDFKDVATSRYAAGLASQADPLEAEAELAHLLHDGVLLETRRVEVEADINALLHRPPDAVLPSPPEDLPVPDPEPTLNLQELVTDALARRPEVSRSVAMEHQRQLELELARLAGRPEVAAFASYSTMWPDTEHRFMIGASLSLPVWRQRVHTAVAEAEDRLAAAQSERLAVEDDVRREVAGAQARWQEAHHILELFRSRLLPIAIDRLGAALGGFKSAQKDFLAVIEAERSLRAVKLDSHQALADLYRRRAELDAALGRRTPAAQAAAPGQGDTP